MSCATHKLVSRFVQVVSSFSCFHGKIMISYQVPTLFGCQKKPESEQRTRNKPRNDSFPAERWGRHERHKKWNFVEAPARKSFGAQRSIKAKRSFRVFSEWSEQQEAALVPEQSCCFKWKKAFTCSWFFYFLMKIPICYALVNNNYHSPSVILFSSLSRIMLCSSSKSFFSSFGAL